MNQSDQFIHKFRQILIANSHQVGAIENTTGNCDDQGNIIDQPIPTITTDFCEIGAYNNTIYFTFIVYSNSYTQKLFDEFKNYPNVQFYGFKNFNTTLYPRSNFNYQKFEQTIRQDKYFQIQFNYNLDEQISNLENLYENYLMICDKIVKGQTDVVNQLMVDLK